MSVCIERSTPMVCARRTIFTMALIYVTTLLLLAQPVVNEMSNNVYKGSTEDCLDHTKMGKRNSYLWTLKNYPSVYIFGSIHRPYSSVWLQVPSNVKRAFQSSKKVYFEIDLQSPTYLLTITKCQYLPNKQTLADVLPRKVLGKLQNYLDFIRSEIPEWLNSNEIKEERNPDKVFKDLTRNWQRKRPIWILLQLAALNKEYVQSRNVPSLDMYMFLKAGKNRKTIGHIESAEGHCGLNNLNSSQAIIYLDELLTKYNLVKKQSYTVPNSNDLKYHYICGNLSNYVSSPKLNVHTSTRSSRLHTLQNFENSLREELFLRRNKQMVKKIIKEIKFERQGKNRRMFFTVGAGHLIGKGSIIDLLKSKGFKPMHILATDTLPRLRRHKMNDQRQKKKKSKRRKTKKVGKLVPTAISSTNFHAREEIVDSSYHSSSSLNLGVRWNTYVAFLLSYILCTVLQ